MEGDRGQSGETPGNAGKRQETEKVGSAFDHAAKALSAEARKPYRTLSSKMQRWSVRGEVDLPSGTHLALERHDRVALAPKPAGLDVAAGQKVMAGMKDGIAQVARAVGMDR